MLGFHELQESKYEPSKLFLMRCTNKFAVLSPRKINVDIKSITNADFALTPILLAFILKRISFCKNHEFPTKEGVLYSPFYTALLDFRIMLRRKNGEESFYIDWCVVWSYWVIMGQYHLNVDGYWWEYYVLLNVNVLFLLSLSHIT